MLKKQFFVAVAVFLMLGFMGAIVAEARPGWVSVSYSGFSIHRNPSQPDINAEGYYFAKIIATCVNNSSDKTISSITSRSMGFTANGTASGATLGTVAGSITISTPESLTPVGPGESFRIEYSVPLLSLNGGSIAPFNTANGPRLSRYSLKHDFQVK